MKKTDFLIIGSGIAGLVLALKLSKIGEVVILTKKDISAGSTGLAQGGIAGVRDTKKDTFKKHFDDTMKSGAYLNNPEAVKFLVENAPRALRDLEEFGVKFDLSLHQEGGHSFRRISHVADETGRAVQEILAEQVRNNQKIIVLENTFAIDLLIKKSTVWGVSYFDGEKSKNIYAQKTILATGGAGQVFLKTTNPSVATGDGIAMALRAGAKVQDLEFVQFHPTAFDYPRDPLFLLSEAMRGEGALLRNEQGERFVDEMNSRDQVARAIFQQKKAYLDFRHEDRSVLAKKFPNIFENLLTAGFDLARDLIPITPAAHFFCGGVLTDIHGQTSLKNLFALGEVACTGVHGANRLASNSLLEAVVFAEAIWQKIKQENIGQDLPKLVVQNFQQTTKSDLKIKQYIQKQMWRYAGLVRTKAGLKTLIQNLQELKVQSTEVQNVLLVALVIAQSAFKQKQSVGCHYLKK